MPVQNFNIYTAKGYAGELVDSGPRTVQTGVLTSASAGFGLAMSRDASVERGVALGGATGNVFAISQREYNNEAGARPAVAGTEWLYNATESVSLMRQGYIYLEVTARPAVAGALANSNDATGAFTGGAAGVGETATTNVYFEEAGIVGDIVKARIDIK